MDVAAWLEGLGLERYAPAFRDNEIDWDALPKLAAEDLKDLGVVLGGHRRKLLHAIAALGAAVPAAAAMAAAPDALARGEAERRQLTVMFWIWSARRLCPRGSIPRICAELSARTIAASQRLSRALAGLSPATWATAS
jgi:hypothetical protein